MKPNALWYMCLLLCLSLLAGCGGCGDDDTEAPAVTENDTVDPDADEPSDFDPDDPAAAMQQAQKAVRDALGNSGDGVKAVDFRKLRDMLPEELDDMKRTNREGQRTNMMGIDVSTAEGRYEGEDGSSIKISIVDMGSLSSPMMLGLGWLMAEVDRESDTGFERTTKYKGHPAFEKCDQAGEAMNCEFSIFAFERFVIEVEGRRVEMDQVEDARDEIDLDDLEDLKDDAS